MVSSSLTSEQAPNSSERHTSIPLAFVIKKRIYNNKNNNMVLSESFILSDISNKYTTGCSTLYDYFPRICLPYSNARVVMMPLLELWITSWLFFLLLLEDVLEKNVATISHFILLISPEINLKHSSALWHKNGCWSW